MVLGAHLLRYMSCSSVPSDTERPMSQKHRILIVDDDHDTHTFIADLLEMYGYEADCVHSSDRP